MTTKEMFKLEKVTLEMLDERAGESSYWAGCDKFVNDKWESEIDRMTQKQANWLDKILEDMVEWRIKNQ